MRLVLLTVLIVQDLESLLMICGRRQAGGVISRFPRRFPSCPYPDVCCKHAHLQAVGSQKPPASRSVGQPHHKHGAGRFRSSSVRCWGWSLPCRQRLWTSSCGAWPVDAQTVDHCSIIVPHKQLSLLRLTFCSHCSRILMCHAEISDMPIAKLVRVM